MFHGIQFPYFNSQQLNLDWIVDKIKGMLDFLPDDGTVGQILRRTADGAEWSDEHQVSGGAVDSVNGKTGDVVLDAGDILMDSGSTVEDEVDDLKSALGYGFYRQADITGDINDADVGISRVTATAGHNPSGKVGFVITMARTAGSRAQIFVNEPVDPYPEKCRLFARFLYNNNWSAWVEFADKTDILDTVWINGTDYSGDLNSAPNGFTRVVANATNNPAGDVGYLLTMQRASTAKGQIFWNSSNFYFRLSTSGTWLDWQSAKNTNLTDRHTGFTFGDSLMAQDGKVFAYDNPQYNVSEIGSMCVGWQTLLHNKFGVTTTNYAVGGQGIAAQKTVIKSKTYTGIDFVIISVGVNDYSNAVQLGQLPTARNATFTDGLFIDDLCDSIEYILTQNPEIKILLFTPCQRDTTWRNSGVPDFSKSATDIYTRNSSGLYLKDYADAIKDIGRIYSCVVCDMYAESGLNYLTLPEFTFDGVHPTNEGYEFTAPVLYEAFKKL